jgi:hypothetical protein
MTVKLAQRDAAEKESEMETTNNTTTATTTEPKPGDTTTTTSPPAAAQTWEKFLEGQPDEIKTLYGEHTKGLQNTVQATRDERDALAKQIRDDLLPKATKGSELEVSLNDTLKKLEASDKRANFAEQAIKPEIGCRNPKVAFALATASDLFKRNGDPDWEAIKKEAPELFGPLIPNANAGNGTEDTTPPVDMNEFLRQATGHNK